MNQLARVKVSLSRMKRMKKEGKIKCHATGEKKVTITLSNNFYFFFFEYNVLPFDVKVVEGNFSSSIAYVGRHNPPAEKEA